jgi:hypothetical protein
MAAPSFNSKSTTSNPSLGHLLPKPTNHKSQTQSHREICRTTQMPFQTHHHRPQPSRPQTHVPSRAQAAAIHKNHQPKTPSIIIAGAVLLSPQPSIDVTDHSLLTAGPLCKSYTSQERKKENSKEEKSRKRKAERKGGEEDSSPCHVLSHQRRRSLPRRRRCHLKLHRRRSPRGRATASTQLSATHRPHGASSSASQRHHRRLNAAPQLFQTIACPAAKKQSKEEGLSNKERSG